MARTFSGSSQVILAPGGLPATNSALSFVALIRNGSSTNTKYPLTLTSSSYSGLVLISNNLVIRYQNSADTLFSPAISVPVGSYSLVAGTKPAGSSVVRGHCYSYASSSWSRSNSSNVIGAVSSTAVSSAAIGSRGAGGYFDGDVAVAAIYAAELTDSQLDELTDSLDAWLDLGPAGLWVLDQPSTSLAVSDWAGAAHQTSLSGTSVSGVAAPDLNYGTLHTSQTPSSTNNSDGTPGITSGVSAMFAAPGRIVAIRYHSTTTIGGTYTGLVWESTAGDDGFGGTGTLLDSTVGGTPLGGTWNYIPVDVPVEPGTLYRIGVHNTQGRYVATTNFFGTALTNGDITAPAQYSNPAGLGTLWNGSYLIDAAPSYPRQAGGGSGTNYFIDVVFIPEESGSGDATGSAALTLPSLSAAGSGTAPAAGTAAVGLPALTTTGSGTVSATGTAAANLPILTAAAAGTPRATGTAAAALPALTAAAAGQASASATAAVALPAPAGSGTGTASATAAGTAALPAVTATGTGVASVQGTGTVTLPATQAAGAGNVAGTVSGGAALTLPPLTTSANGAGTATGSSANALPGLTTAGAATVRATAASSITLPGLTVAAAGQATVSGTAAVTLAVLQAAGSGTTAGVAAGAVTITLPALSGGSTPVGPRRPGVLTAGATRTRLSAGTHRGPI